MLRIPCLCTLASSHVGGHAPELEYWPVKVGQRESVASAIEHSIAPDQHLPQIEWVSTGCQRTVDRNLTPPRPTTTLYQLSHMTPHPEFTCWRRQNFSLYPDYLQSEAKSQQLAWLQCSVCTGLYYVCAPSRIHNQEYWTGMVITDPTKLCGYVCHPGFTCWWSCTLAQTQPKWLCPPSRVHMLAPLKLQPRA